MLNSEPDSRALPEGTSRHVRDLTRRCHGGPRRPSRNSRHLGSTCEAISGHFESTELQSAKIQSGVTRTPSPGSYSWCSPSRTGFEVPRYPARSLCWSLAVLVWDGSGIPCPNAGQRIRVAGHDDANGSGARQEPRGSNSRLQSGRAAPYSNKDKFQKTAEGRLTPFGETRPDVDFEVPR